MYKYAGMKRTLAQRLPTPTAGSQAQGDCPQDFGRTGHDRHAPEYLKDVDRDRKFRPAVKDILDGQYIKPLLLWHFFALLLLPLITMAIAEIAIMLVVVTFAIVVVVIANTAVAVVAVTTVDGVDDKGPYDYRRSLDDRQCRRCRATLRPPCQSRRFWL